MKFMKKNKKGFTLVELMIVVVIMAILVAVAVPIYNSVTTNAKRKTCLANARILSGQVNTILMNYAAGSTTADGSTKTAAGVAFTITGATSASSIASGAPGTMASYLQGDTFPVCPFTGASPAWAYSCAADGKVTCTGADKSGH